MPNFGHGVKVMTFFRDHHDGKQRENKLTCLRLSRAAQKVVEGRTFPIPVLNAFCLSYQRLI